MDEDVVLVTVQYRLGPLGFLSLQNEDIKVQAGYSCGAPESIHCKEKGPIFPSPAGMSLTKLSLTGN